ncbi:hypothetical protein Hdeb2414_s0001g00034511 [Helianthus debilis subsp. tardiflorus]
MDPGEGITGNVPMRNAWVMGCWLLYSVFYHCKTTTSTGSLLVGQRGLLVDSAIRFGTLTTFEENGRELITLKHDQCFDRGIGVGNHISSGHSVIE